MGLSDDQKKRYSRHLVLPELGEEGQLKICGSKILIVGTGGLGSPNALYLAAAGVGTIGIADFDRVDFSNLQRQVAHFTSDVGRLKVESAKNKIEAINPGVNVRVFNTPVNESNACDIVSGFDFVIDATDNFEVRFLLNDTCVKYNIPFSYGGILGLQGQTMTVKPGESPCFRCLFQSPPPADEEITCAQVGLLGPIPGIIGSIQATEALKAVAGVGSLLTGSLLIFDGSTMDFRKIPVGKNPSCPACGV